MTTFLYSLKALQSHLAVCFALLSFRDKIQLELPLYILMGLLYRFNLNFCTNFLDLSWETLQGIEHTCTGRLRYLSDYIDKLLLSDNLILSFVCSEKTQRTSLREKTCSNMVSIVIQQLKYMIVQTSQIKILKHLIFDFGLLYLIPTLGNVLYLQVQFHLILISG